ncbi:hypothetical protein FOZ63_005339 [Perkinsus olseni]|uniref:Uncharacterized protein n=1 Tax=Perkinsus olseni TaxID=32597 RepID=A0A7J6SH47_PEROL|nr:hypothetical protein FOZ63_005339 [Perkinsus olseni]
MSSVADCMMDPGDDGNNHGHKDRDWLCFERRPRFVALPPHGPPLDPTCTENLTTWRALPWYTDKAPPEWCPYNWYHKRQVCWCIPGYVRESLYDGSIDKRGCPNTRSIFIVPRFVTYEEWEKLRNPTTTPPPLPENQTTTAEPGNAPSVRLLDDDDF